MGIKNKKISGYGTDVIEKEFVDINKSIIKNIDKYNIIVTPHIGGMTHQGQLRAYNFAINKIKKKNYFSNLFLAIIRSFLSSILIVLSIGKIYAKLFPEKYLFPLIT